jgi:hypothetical protein
VSAAGAPLLPSPVYGLRTWAVVGEPGAERLGATQLHATWPPGGEWLEASCARSPEHRPPVAGCGCGVHAWHPSRSSARRVLAGRRAIPGVAEARGAIELHEDGFRAERARPAALFLLPGRNARLYQRLAESYGAELLEADGPAELLEACHVRGFGLDESTVAGLLGRDATESWRRERRGRLRADLVRLAVAAVVVTLLVIGGLALASDPPGDRVLNGRTGEIHIESR